MGIPCGTEGSGVASRVRILCQSLLWRAPPGPQPRAVHTEGPSMREAKEHACLTAGRGVRRTMKG